MKYTDHMQQEPVALLLIDEVKNFFQDRSSVDYLEIFLDPDQAKILPEARDKMALYEYQGSIRRFRIPDWDAFFDHMNCSGWNLELKDDYLWIANKK
jgi:hypothetical protein